MKHLAVLLSSLLLAIASPSVQPQPRAVSYDGYRVFRVPVGLDASKVTEIVEKLELDTWKAPNKAGAFADVVVSPDKLQAFNDEVAGIEGIEVMHEDLGASIAAEQEPASQVLLGRAAAAINSTWFTTYHEYADHLSFLHGLQAQYPANSEIVTSGNSLQGNTITGIHIYGSAGKGVNPAVIFHGTVHAREWVTTMTVEYFANILLGEYASDAETKSFVDKYDFYLFPVVNPDGFIYTQIDRLWRKNRQSTPGSSCIGYDLNRNWPYQWDVAGGASTDPCAIDYRGVSAGDTPENESVRDKLAEIKSAQGVKLFIDWHSYAQMFMTPYAYNCSATATNDNELQSLAGGAAEAIASLYGTQFIYGPVCTTIYPASGSSTDYVQDVTQADYVFAAELRDTGLNGFILPASEILPTAQESYEAVKYLLRNMK
ncbi:zinc carboxypeptidase [Diaporthe helianthi]|uniref:Carboxypeptidase M14A n=1 Tax=Diaporthe helianthi TaxID=158607 RepID=A0A2P5HP64_DIAHE|nr:zinc carboxypeptidase [Diaporthe helianthi]